MVNSSMTRRLLSPILLLSLAAGCSKGTTSNPGESQAVEALAQERSDVVSDQEESDLVSEQIDAPPVNRKPVIEFRMEERSVPKVLTPEQRAKLDKMLSEMGEVELWLDDNPATADPLEPGRYFLSISILLSNGRPMKNQRACRVEVDGPDVRILLENSATDPIIATIHDGEFLSEPREGPGTYGFEGKVVGPGKLRGTIIPGPVPHPRIDISEGIWGLDALPLKKEPEKSSSTG